MDFWKDKKLSEILSNEATVNGARLLLSVVFIFSGLVKAVDPKGLLYKINAYLEHFGLVSFQDSIPALGLSVLIPCVEFVLGIYLLFGIRRKFAATMIGIVTLLFTLFTFYLALTNPVADCGCFGDALKLTNWQTFWKNIVLLLCAGIVFRAPTKMVALVERSVHWAYSLYSMIFILFVCLCSYHYLPPIDFRPYKVGTNIRQAIEIGEDGSLPRIMDFFVTDAEGNDYTLNLLNDTSMVFWIVAPRLEDANREVTNELNTLYDYCMDKGYGIVGITSSGEKGVSSWRYDTGASYPILSADEVMLKTMVRSNPGLMLVKDGTILNKWSCHNLPQLYADNKDSEKLLQEGITKKGATKVLIIGLMCYVIPLLFITFALSLRKRRKVKKENKKI